MPDCKRIDLSNLGWDLSMNSRFLFLANFLALLALDCEVVLLPHYLTPVNLKQMAEDYHLSAIITAFDLAPSTRQELSISLLDSRFMILTSGSRGSPKGVAHHWKNLLEAADGFKQHFGLSQLNWGQSLPLFHVAGLMSFFSPLFCSRKLCNGPSFCCSKLSR